MGLGVECSCGSKCRAVRMSVTDFSLPVGEDVLSGTGFSPTAGRLMLSVLNRLRAGVLGS